MNPATNIQAASQVQAMLPLILDAVTITLLLTVSTCALLLHRRIGRLRGALAEAGNVLPALDAAVARMNTVAGGFSTRIQTEMQVVEGRVAEAKRLALELTAPSRAAEEVMARLDAQLRQVRRLEHARATALPRELAEPKGFAERMRRTVTAESTGPVIDSADPAPAADSVAGADASPVDSGTRRVRVSLLSS